MEDKNRGSELLTSSDISAILKVSRYQARVLMDQMPHYNIGTKTNKALRVTRDGLEKWLAQKSSIAEETRVRAPQAKKTRCARKQMQAPLLDENGHIPTRGVAR